MSNGNAEHPGADANVPVPNRPSREDLVVGLATRLVASVMLLCALSLLIYVAAFRAAPEREVQAEPAHGDAEPAERGRHRTADAGLEGTARQLENIALELRETADRRVSGTPPRTFSALPMVLLLGALGAFVSLQHRLSTSSELAYLSYDRLNLLKRAWYLWLTPLTGMVLAVVLYCAFIGGLIQGSIFPEFTEGSEPSELRIGFLGFILCEGKTYADYGKLAVWSFIAGFSEGWVADWLTSLTKRADPDREQAGHDAAENDVRNR